MKDLFPGYYPLSEDEEAELWKSCLFVLDANTMLDLYKYSSTTRDGVFRLFDKIKDRLWVPYQAADEYHAGRQSVMRDLDSAAREVKQRLDDLLKDFVRQALGPYKKFAYIDTESIEKRLQASIEEIKKDLNLRKKEHDKNFKTEYRGHDKVRERLEKLLTGRIGPPFSIDRLAEINRLAADRYANLVPPGFKDRKAGDLILWLQTIDKAKQGTSPIVVVTNDEKADWYVEEGGKVKAHPALINEMWREAKVRCGINTTDDFMDHSAKHLDEKVEEQAIREVRDVRQRVVNANTTALESALARRYIDDIIIRTAPHEAVQGLWSSQNREALRRYAEFLQTRSTETMDEDYWDAYNRLREKPIDGGNSAKDLDVLVDMMKQKKAMDASEAGSD